MTDPVEQAAAKAAKIQKTVNDVHKMVSKLGGSMSESLDDAAKSVEGVNRVFVKTKNSLRDLQRTLTPTTKQVNIFGDGMTQMAESAEKGETALRRAFMMGEKYTAGALGRLKNTQVEMNKSVISARNYSQELENMSAQYQDQMKGLKSLANGYGKLSVELKQAEAELKSLDEQFASDKSVVMTKRVEDAKDKVAGLTANMKETALSIDDANASITNMLPGMETMAENFRKTQEEIVNQRTKTIELIKTERELNRQIREANGGFGAMFASLERIGDSKAWDLFGSLVKGGMFIYAGKQMLDAVEATGSYLKGAQRIAMQTGGVYETGIAGFGAAVADAQVLSTSLATTAGKLGMKFEEVQATADQLRHSLASNDPKLIGRLTDEALEFSKVMGVDATTAVEMLESGIKGSGKSAAQAASDLVMMRKQMTETGNYTKGTNIQMGEFLSLVNEGRATIGSYTVDTRLMTQVMRSAANQALNMGASQKLAKDVAKASATVLGKAPEFLKIPANQTLMAKLKGDPKDLALDKMSPDLKKRVLKLRDDVLSGKVGEFSGAAALGEMLKGEKAGMDATYDSLLNVAGVSGEMSHYIEKWGLADTPEAAYELSMQIKSAKEQQMQMNGFADQYNSTMASIAGLGESDALKKIQDRLKVDPETAKRYFDEMKNGQKKITTGITEAMGDGLETLTDTLQGMSKSDAMKKLGSIGLDDAGAKSFMALQEDHEAELKRISESRMTDAQKASAREQSATRMMYEQSKMLTLAQDPLQKTMNTLGKMSGKSIAIDSKINLNDLVKQVGSFEKVMDQLGVKGNDEQNKLKKLMEEGKSASVHELTEAAAVSSEAISGQEKILNDLANKTDSMIGLLTSIKQSLLPSLSGPLGKMILATVGVGVGILGYKVIMPFLLKHAHAFMAKNPATQLLTAAINSLRSAIARMSRGGRGGSGGLFDDMSDGDTKSNKKTKGGKAGKAGKLAKLGKFGLNHGKKLLGAAGAVFGGAMMAKDIYDAQSDASLSPEERKSQTTRASIKGVANVAGGALGGFLGAAGGTMLMPGAGTLAGGSLGGIAGAGAGEWVGEHLANLFSPEKAPTGMSDVASFAAPSMSAMPSMNQAMMSMAPSASLASGGGQRPSLGGMSSSAASGPGSTVARFGRDSLNLADGSLTVKFEGFADNILAQFSKAQSLQPK